MMEQIAQMQENIDKVKKKDFILTIYKMEVKCFEKFWLHVNFLWFLSWFTNFK